MRVVLRYLLITFCLVSMISSVLAQDADPVVNGNSDQAAETIDILPPKAIFLGEKEESGVLAMAWVYRVPTSELQATPEQQYPYLLFARFLSVESNVHIEKGLAAYKLESFDEEKTPARKMEFKNGYFVAGLDSSAAAYSTLHIGCKLEDEKKRQFQYRMRTY